MYPTSSQTSRLKNVLLGIPWQSSGYASVLSSLPSGPSSNFGGGTKILWHSKKKFFINLILQPRATQLGCMAATTVLLGGWLLFCLMITHVLWIQLYGYIHSIIMHCRGWETSSNHRNWMSLFQVSWVTRLAFTHAELKFAEYNSQGYFNSQSTAK